MTGYDANGSPVEEWPGQDLDAIWEGARKVLRDAGHDPDVVIARAAENLAAWRARPADAPPPPWFDEESEVTP